MKNQWLRSMLSGLAAAIVITSISFAGSPMPPIARATHIPPTPAQALAYAKTVIWVKRVVLGNEIHSYVREVWRFDPSAGGPPAIGSEFGHPTPLSPMMRNPERDGIEFMFGSNRPPGMPQGWTIQILENGSVMPFRGASIFDVRSAVLDSSPRT